MDTQNRFFAFVICLVAGLCPTQSNGAPDLKIYEAVQSAISRSPAIKVAEAQTANFNWKKTEAFSAQLPNLSVSSNYLLAKKYLITDVKMPGSNTELSFPQIIPTSALVANLQIPVFDGFATTNKVAAATDSYESAKLNLDWQKFQVERDVILQFYRAVAAEQLLAVAKQSQRALEDHLKDTRLFKGAGMSTHYDVLRVEVQASEARSEVMNAEDNVAIARIKLAELMGENIDVTGVRLRVPQGQLPQLKIDLIKSEVDKIQGNQSGNTEHFIQRKDLEALQLKLDGLSKSASAASRHYFPKLSLFAQYQYYNNKNDKFSDAGSYRNSYSTGVSLNWTLFDGLTSTAKFNEIASEKSELEYSVQMRRQRALVDLEFWRRKFLYFVNLTQARTGDVGKSAESVRLARAGLKEGTRTMSDLLDAESELFRARAGAINAQVSSIESLLNLEVAMGKSLYKFW